VNTNAAELIYSQMLGPAMFPQDMMTGSPETIASLKARFHQRRF
jgi:hypothetical protein